MIRNTPLHWLHNNLYTGQFGNNEETRRGHGEQNGKLPDKTPLHGPGIPGDHGAVDIHDATGSGGQYTRDKNKTEIDGRDQKFQDISKVIPRLKPSGLLSYRL